MLGEQTPKDIKAATRCDGDHDAERPVRVPGSIGAGGGGEEPDGGEQGRAKQQVTAECHGEKSRLAGKIFLSNGEKYQEKEFCFFIATRERLPSGGVWGRLFSHDAPPTSFQPVSVAGDFTQA
jgi:hypothetical protein